MLMVGSTLVNYPVLSLHVGGLVSHTVEPIIDPESLSVIAYELDTREIDDPEAGSILMIEDVRELSDDGLIIDSTDRLVEREDVIKLDKIMDLEFKLIGLKVVTKDGKKLGKVIDYTLDTGSFSIFQLIVQRPFLDAIVDPELTINRSQIVEIDDEKITIKHDKQKVRLPKANSKKDFVPNYVNPFRKPNYSEEDKAESSSSTSE
jgi:uncharacterized protein YrrD